MSTPPQLKDVLAVTDGTIATLTLDLPARRNVLTGAMLSSLATAFEWCRDDPDIHVVVLTGAGSRAFCAGADLGSQAHGSGLDGFYQRRRIADLYVLIEELGKPLIGRINGDALGGGFGLACACDLLVSLSSAKFGLPEINVGFWPMIIQPILTRNLPRKVVFEMMALGERVTAEQLHTAGLINRVVEQEALDETTYDMARRLAAKSPAILRLGRDAFYRQQDMEFRAALAFLHGQLSAVMQTEDSKEGTRAFQEKREPRFVGR